MTVMLFLGQTLIGEPIGHKWCGVTMINSKILQSKERTELVRSLLNLFSASVENGRLCIETLVPRMTDFLRRIGINQSRAVTHHVRRILVIRLEEIGDLVLGSSFLRELRRNQPFAHITLLVKPECKNLVEWCPYVNEVLVVRTWVRGESQHGLDILRDIAEFSVDLMFRQPFDICLVPRYDHDYYYSGLLCFLSGAPVRIGFSEHTTVWKEKWNRGYDTLYTKALPPVEVVHEVERNLRMISSLGGKIKSNKIEVWTDVADELWAKKLMQGLQGKTIAIAVGVPNDCRHWPVQRYAEIVKWLGEEYAMGTVLYGTLGEVAISQQLSEQLTCKVLDVTGKTTLRQTAALLRHCSFYLGRDTGVMHLAAAVGIPVLEITPHNQHGDPGHSLSCERYGPWGVPAVLVRPEHGIYPCSKGCIAHKPHCIEQIGVEEVKQGVRKLFTLIGKTF